jgi:hypothetical protein
LNFSSITNRFKRKEQPAQPDPIQRIEASEISDVINHMDPERIRRYMMLLDIRWLDEQYQSFIPTEEQIVQHAYRMVYAVVNNGRRIGAWDMSNRGFRAEYFVSPNRKEIVKLSYVICEGSNILSLN